MQSLVSIIHTVESGTGFKYNPYRSSYSTCLNRLLELFEGPNCYIRLSTLLSPKVEFAANHERREHLRASRLKPESRDTRQCRESLTDHEFEILATRSMHKRAGDEVAFERTSYRSFPRREPFPCLFAAPFINDKLRPCCRSFE